MGGSDSQFQKNITGSFTAAAQTQDLTSPNQGTSVIQLIGTWVGTLILEGSNDGTTYVAINLINAATRLNQSSITANGFYLCNTNGYAQIRLRASAWTSGTATINVFGSDALSFPLDPTYGNNGEALPPQSQLIGGSNGTNIYPLKVDDQGRLVTSAITGFGADFSFGDVTTSSTTRVVVRRTTYTEQTTNGQRSIASSSANDTSAGTGARTLKITYLDSTGAGPFTETMTLNGTARVNTVATNICFIEQIEILTAGSGGVNVGTITLFTVPTSGGSAIGTIAVGDNQTFWAHHYVPLSKECNVTGISCGHNGTTVGSGALFTLNSKMLNNSVAVETQLTDFVRLYGQTSTFARNYTSPIKVSGPVRIQTYVTPETSTSTIYRAAFDFFEP